MGQATDPIQAGSEDAERMHDDIVFESLWARALEAWEEDKVHASLLEHALRSEKLPELAGRYRAILKAPASTGRDPYRIDGADALTDRTKRAEKMLDAIVIAATQMMLSMKSPPPAKMPLSITLSAAGVCAALLGLLAYALLHHGH